MVREVIHIINGKLSGLTTGASIYGLAHSMVRVQGTVKELLPCIIEQDGEGKYVGLDDINKLMIYHKMNSANGTQSLNGKGDNPGDMVNTYNMALIISWNRKSLDIMADEMLMLVQANIPILIPTLPDIKLVRIRITGANLDTLQIIAQEYQSESLKIPSNILLMQVNYSIEITFNPACIKACP